MSDPEHLFVYGTLRAGGEAHAILAGGAELVGSGRIPGRLFRGPGYPAAVLAAPGDAWIRGEVYRMTPERAPGLLARLDRYEGFRPHQPARSLFRRTRVDVVLDAGGLQPAWTYEFNRPTAGLEPLPSGDWQESPPPG